MKSLAFFILILNGMYAMEIDGISILPCARSVDSLISNHKRINISVYEDSQGGTGSFLDLISDLDRSIPQMMAEVNLPGLSIALLDGTGIIWQGNYGVESIKRKTAIDDSTIFVAASFSKVIFGYLIIKMVDKGKFDLDTPLIQLVPRSYIEKEFKKINDNRFDQITARMVLTHTTGIPDLGILGRYVKIDSKPGSEFSYSGDAFYLMQKIMEYLEGLPINTIMRENVFLPLGMSNTSFVYEEKYEGRMARGHDHWLSSVINWRFLKNQKPHSARSLLTSTDDFAKFLVAYMNGKDLKPETLNEMLSPQVGANSTHIFWGLGIGMEIVASDTTYWHDGEGIIFENYFAFQKGGIGFVYFSNSANGLSIGQEIAEKIIPANHPSFRWIGIEQYYSTKHSLEQAFTNDGIEASINLYYELKVEYPWKIEENTFNDFGYYLLGMKLFEESIRIFKLNLEAYPKSWNTYDSLGEAYMKSGKIDLALEYYEKSREVKTLFHDSIDTIE